MTKQPNAKGSSFLAPIPMADLKPILRGAAAAVVTLLALGLTAAGLLAGCSPGRWEVEDLSSYSYSFGPAATHKPFAPRDAKRFQPASWSAVQPIQ